MNTPNLSIILSAIPSVAELTRFVEMLKRQTLHAWELLVPQEKTLGEPSALANLARDEQRIRLVELVSEPTPATCRNELLAKATGTFVVFASIADRYLTANTLELVTLWATLEDTSVTILGLQQEVSGKYVSIINPQVQEVYTPERFCPYQKGLSAFFCKRAWLNEQALAFISNDPQEDFAFVAKILALSKKTIARPGIVIAQKGIVLPNVERIKDRLESVLTLAQFSAERGFARLHGSQFRRLFSDHRRDIFVLLREEREWTENIVRAIESARIPEMVRPYYPDYAEKTVNEAYFDPIVSVIVPVYNVEAYLERCLESLRKQTLEQIEIICVNDGSTDNSLAILEAAQEKIPNLVIHSQENGGLSAARNAGMKIARGRYVGFVDSDDWVEPVMFQKMAEALDAHPECEFAMCGVSAEYTYPVSAKAREGLEGYFTVPGVGKIPLTPALLRDLNVSVCCKLFRLSFLRENDIRFPYGLKNEDNAFFAFVMCRAYNAFFFQAKWYHYLRNASGIMATALSTADAAGIPDVFKALNLVLCFLQREDSRRLLGVFFRHLCGAVNQYATTPAGKITSIAAAKLLKDADFYHTKDFLLPPDRGHVASRLQELFALDTSDFQFSSIDQNYFPCKQAPRKAAFAVPKLTYIVPVFNAEQYLMRCLESLRAQTLPDIEILCINDGSWDDSLAILNEYAERDSRIRVISKVNSGVADSRNIGVQSARGNYVVFIDGDDWIEPTMAAECIDLAESNDLDMLYFDYQCFDYQTEAPINHYWTLAHHVNKFPKGVFSCRDLTDCGICGGSCIWLYRRTFLIQNHLQVPKIKLGEDFTFVMRAFSRARRCMILPKVFYRYRRGNPSSAISRLSATKASSAAKAQLELLETLADTYQTICSTNYSTRTRNMFLARFCMEIFFYAEKTPEVLAWLHNGGWGLFDASNFSEKTLGKGLYNRYLKLQSTKPAIMSKTDEIPTDCFQNMPRGLQRVLRSLMTLRHFVKQDLYIITGQLNSTENEPIDSWTFFQWLQANGVPSRYVIWKKHKDYPRLKKEGKLKDVIVMRTDCFSSIEFVTRCFIPLVRAKVVAQENGALNPCVRQWLIQSDINYTFLQHGLFFWAMDPRTANFLSIFNTINTASTREAELLGCHVPANALTQVTPQYVIAGLPRWDLLKDESKGKPPIVFIMFTGRYSFKNKDDLLASMYLQNIKALLAQTNLERLKKKGVKVVLAPHHHLVNVIKDFDFNIDVEIASTQEISAYIRRAACCVTDISSVSFDFLYLQKPVIYWRLDKYDTRLHPSDRQRILFAESQASQMFNNAQSAEDVILMLEHYADTGFVLEPKKRAIAKTFFAHKRNICKHLYQALEQIPTSSISQFK